jgi:hypothetical protein
MKVSVIENRWEKILYSKRFIKQEIQVSVFPGAISWINMNELHFIQSTNRDNQEQKLLRQPHFPILCCVNDWKRENSTHFFQHWPWGQGGGRRTLKWPKMWQVSLFLLASNYDLHLSFQDVFKFSRVLICLYFGLDYFNV